MTGRLQLLSTIDGQRKRNTAMDIPENDGRTALEFYSVKNGSSTAIFAERIDGAIVAAKRFYAQGRMYIRSREPLSSSVWTGPLATGLDRLKDQYRAPRGGKFEPGSVWKNGPLMIAVSGVG